MVTVAEEDIGQSPQQHAVDLMYQALPAHIDLNMTYLNATVNWAMTICSGGIAAVVLSNSFPSGNSYILLSVLFVVLGHLFVRTAKAYINVMRFTTLHKLIFSAIASNNYDASFAAVQRYYVEWVCPLSVDTVLKKTFLEFGYLYLWGFMLVIFLYCATGWQIVLGLLSHVVVLLDVYFFLIRSPYLARVEVLDAAMAQR